MHIIKQMAQNAENTVIVLSELEQGKHKFAFELNSTYFQGIEKSEILGGDVHVEAELNVRESDYDLHLRAQGTVQLTCDRCLGTMDYAVDAEDTIQPDEDEQSDELDLSWLAYETITINLPMVHSHPEGECIPDMQQLLQALGVSQDDIHLSSAAEPE